MQKLYIWAPKLNYKRVEQKSFYFYIWKLKLNLKFNKMFALITTNSGYCFS